MQQPEKICKHCLYFDPLTPGNANGKCFIHIFTDDETPTVNQTETCQEWSDGEDA